MMPDGSKSWLLGARYDWRTSVLSSVTADSKDGLSLTPFHTIKDEETAPAPPSRPRQQVGRLFYDVDRELREVSVYTEEGKLRHRWISRDDRGSHVPPTDLQTWDPVEIVGDENCAFLLDQRYQVIYTHVYGRESLSLLVRSEKPGSWWSRIAIDDSGCLLVFDANEAEASVFNRRGELLRTARAIWPTPVAGPDPSKTKSSELDPGDGPSYPESGSWLSKPLDSGIYNCPWHRIEMTLKCLPPGTQVEVRTFAFEQLDMAPVRPDDPRLVEAYTAVAPTQPRPEDRKKERVEEFLIKGGPGRFISVLVILRGDGFGSAVVEGLRLHYPRESYLEYLPPLYSGNEPMRQFLERFLSIFQTEWDEFDRKVEESDRFLDLNAVPEGDAMTYLASWLGLELEGSWKGEQNRQLLRAVPKIFPRRGTLSALQDYVRVYLANIAGLPVEQVAQTSFPAFVEGFRERQYFLLSQPDGSTLGRAKPLWSPGVVKRLQVGVFSREGDVELVSTGDPERDLIHHFAHRFRVYAPAAWVRTAEHETLLRRAIEAEMPGHVTYELCLVEAGVRVGIQSTVGLDTIVGDPPARHLSCKPEEAAASLPTQNRLGEGAALSGRGKGPAVLDTGARVGNWILN